MMNLEKEHKRSTIMSAKKKELVDQIMWLEHNNNVLNNTLDQQAKNFEVLKGGLIEKVRSMPKTDIKMPDDSVIYYLPLDDVLKIILEN